jgi:tRNA dimethylallyltransferase
MRCSGVKTRQINETHARGQLPIVVGGTAYWMQHLLFPDRLTSVPEPDSSGSDLAPSPALEKAVAALPEPLAQLYGRLPDLPLPEAEDLDGTLALHQLLSALDPAVAERWHWKDARKVLRSLTIIRENGRLNSEIIAEQSQAVILPRYAHYQLPSRSMLKWWMQVPDPVPLAIRGSSGVPSTIGCTGGRYDAS